jgi:hypothetical protein
MQMIKVTGTARLSVDYEVELDMSVEEWEMMNLARQDELIDGYVNWMEVCRNARTDDIDVDDVVVIDKENKQ